MIEGNGATTPTCQMSGGPETTTDQKVIQAIQDFLKEEMPRSGKQI